MGHGGAPDQLDDGLTLRQLNADRLGEHIVGRGQHAFEAFAANGDEVASAEE